MPSGSVRKGLQTKVLALLEAALDQNSSAQYKVVTFDKKLQDKPIDELPYVVVTVMQKDQHGPGEFGTLKELWDWQVSIYYLDIANDYDTGEERHDWIVDKIEEVLETAYNLQNLSVTLNTAGNTERVYDSNFSSVLFDSSGQSDYYTFSSQLYLTVNTQRN